MKEYRYKIGEGVGVSFIGEIRERYCDEKEEPLYTIKTPRGEVFRVHESYLSPEERPRESYNQGEGI